LAEGVARAVEAALGLLAETSPAVSPAEAARSGTWPRRAALQALQDQAVAVAQGLVLVGGGGGGGATMMPARRRRLAAQALRIAAAIAPFLDALDGSSPGVAAERLQMRAAECWAVLEG
jgi:hypothetical protein